MLSDSFVDSDFFHYRIRSISLPKMTNIHRPLQTKHLPKRAKVQNSFASLQLFQRFRTKLFKLGQHQLRKAKKYEEFTIFCGFLSFHRLNGKQHLQTIFDPYSIFGCVDARVYEFISGTEMKLSKCRIYGFAMSQETFNFLPWQDGKLFTTASLHMHEIG